VYKNVVITGAHVQEGPSIGAAGDTRGWDVHSGNLLWMFHSAPRSGETGSETWKGADDDSVVPGSQGHIQGFRAVEGRAGREHRRVAGKERPDRL
jgi:hypothetical protein